MTTPPPAEPPVPLRQAAATGVKWMSGAALVGFVTGIVQPLVLVRLLEPRDFGLSAAVFVLVGLVQAFSDAGISNSIQIRREIDGGVVNSLFWLTVAFAVGLAALVFATAPLLADFYGEPEVAGLARWAALGLLLIPLGSMPKALLQRDLSFAAVARAESLGGVAGLVVAIVAAALGAGAVAIIWGWVAAIAVRGVALMRAGRTIGWRPRLRFRRADLRGHAGFGLYQMAERSLTYVVANVDYLLIGRFLGAEALGIYSIAWQIAIRPLLQVNPVIVRVAIPVFAKRQDDDAALGRGLVETTRLIGFVTVPLLVGLALLADVFVPVVLGARWEASIPLLEILAIVGLLKTLGNPIGPVFLAKDRPDIGFKISATVAPLLTLLLLAVVERGVEAVAWAQLFYAVVAAFVATPWVIASVIGLSPRRYASAIRTSALLTAAMAAATLAAVAGLGAAGASDALVLAGATLAGGAVYVVLLVRAERAYLADIWRLLRGRARPAAEAAPAATRG